MKCNILTVGDVVGRSGLQLLLELLPRLRTELDLHCVIVDADNVNRGRGLISAEADQLFAAGADVLTTGDHVWDKTELKSRLEQDARIIRAANFPAQAAGRGFTTVSTDLGIDVTVIHLLGRAFMPLQVDCPFRTANRVLTRLDATPSIRVVDFHAETTSEKMAMGAHLDGRVGVVFGTHTHVPTADCRILRRGTGYITDLGMTGPYQSVIGRDEASVLSSILTGMRIPWQVATEDVRLGAAVFTVESPSGRCIAARRLEIQAGEEVGSVVEALS